MALIECVECKKQISESAKICPNCGYKRKKIFKSNKLKYELYNLKMISLILVVLSFITSFFEVSFSRDNYSSDRQLLNKSFNDIMYEFIDNLDMIFVIIGIFSIFMLIFSIFKSKLKLKKIFYYVPTFIYSLMSIIISFLVIIGNINVHASNYDTYYGIQWGGIWILIMLCSASIILIIDLLKNEGKKEINR